MSTQVADSDTDESTTNNEDAPVIEGVSDPGFEAIVDADVLDGFIDPATALVDEAKIHLNKGGLEMRAVDPANVGMIDASVSERAFEHFTGTGGVIGVDLGKLQDVIAFAEDDDLVHMALDGETRKLHIKIDDFEYTLTLIDPDSIRQEPEIPDLDLGGEVIVEAKELSRGVTAADMVSDHIALGIDVDADAFVIEANGDADDVRLEITRDDLTDLTASDVRSLYSLDYLKDMDSVIPSDVVARLELGEEFPVKIHFSTASSTVEVTFMLAPRIQSS